MKDFVLIQIREPFEGRPNITLDCFKLIGIDGNITNLREIARDSGHPEWFLIIQAFLIL